MDAGLTSAPSDAPLWDMGHFNALHCCITCCFPITLCCIGASHRSAMRSFYGETPNTLEDCCVGEPLSSPSFSFMSSGRESRRCSAAEVNFNFWRKSNNRARKQKFLVQSAGARAAPKLKWPAT